MNKVHAYFNATRKLVAFSYCGGYKYATWLFLLGLMSCTLHIFAFLLSIKSLTNESIIVALHDLTGIDGKIVGLALVFLLLFLWAISTNKYRVGMIYLENKLEVRFSTYLLEKQSYFSSLLNAWVEPLEEHKEWVCNIPSKMARCSKQLFSVFLNAFVVLVVVSTLAIINLNVTVVLTFFLLSITAMMPRMHRAARLKKKQFYSVQAESKKEISKLAGAIEDTKKSIGVFDLLSSFSASSRKTFKSNVEMLCAVEKSALVVNMFFAFAITSLLGYYMVRIDDVGRSAISELAIYLIFLRFLSSYCSNFFRQLSIYNSELLHVIRFVKYVRMYQVTTNKVNEIGRLRPVGVFSFKTFAENRVSLNKDFCEQFPEYKYVSFEVVKNVSHIVKIGSSMEKVKDYVNTFDLTSMVEFEQLKTRTKIAWNGIGSETDFIAIASLIKVLAEDKDALLIESGLYSMLSGNYCEMIVEYSESVGVFLLKKEIENAGV